MLYVSLAVIQAILFEAHFLIYATMRDILGAHGSLLIALKIIFLALSLSFTAGSLLAHTFQNRFVRAVYTAAATWFGFMVYILLASALYWLIVLCFGQEISDRGADAAGLIFFALALCVGIYGLVNASIIRVRYITVSMPKLPEAWKKRKAVLVSDIHLGQIRGKGFAQKLARMIKSLSPDIVFFAGDVFDGVKVDADGCLAPLGAIGAPLGAFFARGNHEEFKKDSAEEYSAALRRAGIVVLENQTRTVDGVEIIGIPDSDATDKEKYQSILANMTDGRKTGPRILLKHTPVFTDVAVAAGIDLELSGHTHAGQVFPINLITPLLFKERNYGLSKHGALTTYTSSGAGTWGPPMRIGTNPEIVVISFEDTSG